MQGKGTFVFRAGHAGINVAFEILIHRIGATTSQVQPDKNQQKPDRLGEQAPLHYKRRGAGHQYQKHNGRLGQLQIA